MTACGAGPVVLAATRVGGSHEAVGVPCQDAYAWAEAGGGVLVIAVADGLGTAPRSDEGAAIAVEAAVNGALAARAALEAHAEECAVALSDLASTLVFVAVKEGTVCVAQVGDGAVVAEVAEGLALVSGPDHGEYVNEVVPLTAGSWLEGFRVSR